MHDETLKKEILPPPGNYGWWTMLSRGDNDKPSKSVCVKRTLNLKRNNFSWLTRTIFLWRKTEEMSLNDIKYCDSASWSSPEFRKQSPMNSRSLTRYDRMWDGMKVEPYQGRFYSGTISVFATKLEERAAHSTTTLPAASTYTLSFVLPFTWVCNLSNFG
jgi:hypothetical protein